MPKWRDYILFEGVSFRYCETLDDGMYYDQWVCELIDQDEDSFYERISMYHSHSDYYHLPSEDCEVIEQDDARFISYGAGI